jgi:hypothetical protein
MNNKEINPKNQYNMSYNNNMFYYYSLNGGKIQGINDIPTFCSNIGEYEILEPYSYQNRPRKIKCIEHPTATKDSGGGITHCALANQICDNYIFANKLQKIQTKHTGADSRSKDIKNIGTDEFVKTVNLGVGIVVLTAIIYKIYT